MIDVEVTLVGETELQAVFNKLPINLKTIIGLKLKELTEALRLKVVANVSGVILNQKSGQLAGSIREETDVANNPMVGTVFPYPASAKAWALEQGGNKWYAIVPINKKFLRFTDKEGAQVFTKFVNHPPSREFKYLRTSLEEMIGEVEGGFRSAIDEALETL